MLHFLTFENASSRILKLATTWISEYEGLGAKENLTRVSRIQKTNEQTAIKSSTTCLTLFDHSSLDF